MMSIRKEDLHQLVDLLNEHDAKLVYNLIKAVIEKDCVVKADHAPCGNRLKQAPIAIENAELMDWNDIHR